MTQPTEPPADPERSHRTRERALVLVVLGIALLMPPMATTFHLELKIGGVPVALIYLFLVWAALIAGAWWQARRLTRELTSPEEEDR